MITSGVPSPSTSPTATRTPPVNESAYAWMSNLWVPSIAYTWTTGSPPPSSANAKSPVVATVTRNVRVSDPPSRSVSVTVTAYVPSFA